MKAVRSHKPAGLEGIEGLVYEDAPDPQPAIDDALVQVRALTAGIEQVQLVPDWCAQLMSRDSRPRNERRLIIPLPPVTSSRVGLIAASSSG